MAEAAPPARRETGVGEGYRHKEAALPLGSGRDLGGWMGGLSGRDPYPRDRREEKAESAGPDGATVPGPRHPIHRMGGKKGGEGRPHPGSQSWPALLPGAGLKTPGKQRGPGRRSGRGRDTDGDRRATAGGWLRLLLLLVLKMPFVPPRTLPMTPIANMY